MSSAQVHKRACACTTTIPRRGDTNKHTCMCTNKPRDDAEDPQTCQQFVTDLLILGRNASTCTLVLNKMLAQPRPRIANASLLNMSTPLKPYLRSANEPKSTRKHHST